MGEDCSSIKVKGHFQSLKDRKGADLSTLSRMERRVRREDQAGPVRVRKEVELHFSPVCNYHCLHTISDKDDILSGSGIAGAYPQLTSEPR